MQWDRLWRRHDTPSSGRYRYGCQARQMARAAAVFIHVNESGQVTDDTLVRFTLHRRQCGKPVADLAKQVDRERPAPKLRRPCDRRIALAPVVAASGEQAHGVAVAAHDQPVSIMLDLVHPVGPRRSHIQQP
jgi:hypothetical protein